MVTKAFYTVRPEPLLYMALPTGEADIWLRKNIEQITYHPETDEILYEADEAYMRTTVAEEDVEADFDSFYEAAAAWQPQQTRKKSRTPEERIEALEKAVKSMKQAETSADLSAIMNDIAEIKRELNRNSL